MKNKIKIDFEHPKAVTVRKQIVKALAEYNLLEQGDKLMVCVSGGKDSAVLLALLGYIQKRAPYSYNLEAVMLDQKQPNFDATRFASWVREDLGIQLHIVEKDTYSVVTQKVQEGSTFCSLCSRLRRAILYDFATEKDFTKMALGHHRDDLNQTLLLNLFYTGKLSSMPPKLLSDDKRNIVIRPMIYVAEDDLIELSKLWQIPLLPCNLCGSQPNLKRKKMKVLLQELQKEIPHINESMLTAQSNIKLSHLRDESLFDFNNLKTDRTLATEKILNNPSPSSLSQSSLDFDDNDDSLF